MTKEKIEMPIGFKISGINTEQFAVLEDVYDKEKDISINAGLQFSVDPKQKGIGVHFTVQFKHEEDVFLLLKTGCFFLIDPNKWNELLSENEKSIVFPKKFISHLSVLTIGTTRGILHEKLKEDPTFNQFLLPTINVMEIVKEDVIIAF